MLLRGVSESETRLSSGEKLYEVEAFQKAAKNLAYSHSEGVNEVASHALLRGYGYSCKSRHSEGSGSDPKNLK